MKKYLTITALLVAGSAFASAEEFDASKTLLITFGTNGGASVETHTGSFLEQTGQTYNIISTANSSTASVAMSGLKYANASDAKDISVYIGQPVSGTDGRVTKIVDSEDVGKVFDTSLMSGVANYTGGTWNIRFAGLSVGTYTMYVFAGRGNGYGGTAATDTNTYSISGNNVTDVSASIVGYCISTGTVAIEPTVNSDNSITAYTQSLNDTAQSCDNWVLMSYTFSLSTVSDVCLNTAGDGCGSFGAIGLVAIPEPSAFGLLAGLGALALVASRRRRK